MNWSTIPPLDPESLVWVVATAGSRPERSPRWFYIFARAERIPGLDWWKPRADVTALLGAGENAGILRIHPGGQHSLRPRMGRGNTPCLGLPAFPWIPQGKRGPEAVPFIVDGTHLNVTLPAWALRPNDGEKTEEIVHALR